MKNHTRTLLPFILTLTILGCSEPIERKGIVTDRETNEPLEGVSVEIYLGIQKRDTLSEKVFTDQNGYFHVQQKEDSDKLFVLHKDGYIGYVNALSKANDTIRLEKAKE